MNLPRSAGILLHPTSLPSPFGVGDFGPAAYSFIDALAAAGQSLWQVLPLCPIGHGNSPYQSYSASAGETLLISPQLLADEGLLSKDDLKQVPAFPKETVNYAGAREWKAPLLAKAYQAFRAARCSHVEHEFQQFCADHGTWLDDYALFVALREHLKTDGSWTDWEKDVACRNPAVIARYRERLSEPVERQKYWQFLFYKQWGALRKHCADRGIRVVGDIPIYVSHDSADVWAHPKQFLLDAAGNPTVVSGVPPDYFSKTGQRWGNPIYNWAEMERSGFEWWIDRFRGMFRLYDVLRVDHFRGFEAYWEVPAPEETAINGKWVKAPGEKLFHAVIAALGPMEIIAENLGDITAEVEALREKFGFPGMAILQFAFGIEGNAASYRPHNLIRDVIAYTGTHDNDTAMGWWNSNGGDSTRNREDIEREREFTLRYLGRGGEPMNWKMIRAISGSVARVAMVPMQDVLELDSSARMNRPGCADGNWGWRMAPGAFTPELQRRMRCLAEVYDRLPCAEHRRE